MSGFKLYEIDQLLRDAIIASEEKINPETGEIPEDWSSFLDACQMERDQKCLAVAVYIKERRAEANAISEEAKALENRAQIVQASADRLEAYIERYVKPGEKISDSRTLISWRKSSSIIVDKVGALPDSCWKVEKSISKTAVKEALGKKEIGSDVAHIQVNNNIQIK